MPCDKMATLCVKMAGFGQNQNCKCLFRSFTDAGHPVTELASLKTQQPFVCFSVFSISVSHLFNLVVTKVQLGSWWRCNPITYIHIHILTPEKKRALDMPWTCLTLYLNRFHVFPTCDVATSELGQVTYTHRLVDMDDKTAATCFDQFEQWQLLPKSKAFSE